VTTPLRVLIVEDDENDEALLLRALRRGGYAPIHERVETAEGMREALKQPWDVVVSDWGMPQFSARLALGVLQEAEVDLPFIICSGTVGEEAAVAALQAGAHDFLAKGSLTRLIPAIEREMREAKGRAERRIVERQLRQTQKMEAMGQLTGGIAHDFNNLLGVIVANADLLLEQVKNNPEQADLTKEILNSAMHGAELTHRLLAFARQQPLSAQLIELNAQLPRIIGILRRTLGERIRITTNFAEGLWQTRVDPSQVEDALLNLAINARDAMPKGGLLTIETANMQLDEHYTALHPEVTAGDYVMLAMTDSGTGMPPEVVERAMEPFFTTKEVGKGTGLGLSMIYGFAKQSGGHAHIYSNLGVGTTVRLYLPRAEGEVAAAEPVAAPAIALPLGGETILLVDDNSALRRVTLRRLTNLGYQVHDAEDGPAALALMDKGQHFDLLFTDIGLPGGMDGFELAVQARHRQPDLKVLFTTGYGNLGDLNGDTSRQPEHLLRKPYRNHELAEKLRQVLGSDEAPAPK
jgi:signal transduction histidine kinase